MLELNLTRKLFLTIGIGFFLVITNQPNAQTSQNDVSWKITFLSDGTRCSVVEDHKLNEMSNLIEKYFEMYNLVNHSVEHQCVFSEEYSDNSGSSYVDLNILIFDQKIGNESFQRYGYDGLYAHYGSDRMTNHVIMIALPSQFSSSYEVVEFPWSLSEKLSQFILSYYGYNLESIERILYSNELEYSDCMHEKGIQLECSKLKTFIDSDISSDKIPVRAPINEIVEQKSLKYLSSDLYSSSVVTELQREVTGWWLEGLIDDESYLNSLKIIVDVPIENNRISKSDQLLITNGFSILEKTLINKKLNKIEEGGIIPAESELYKVLKYTPFDMDSIELDSQTPEIPKWFKNRAMLWHEHRLEDRVFLDGINALVQNGLILEN